MQNIDYIKGGLTMAFFDDMGKKLSQATQATAKKAKTININATKYLTNLFIVFLYPFIDTKELLINY